MKKFFSISMLVVFISAGLFAQDKNISKAPKNFANETVIVYGPWIESDNQINESFENATFPPAGWTKLNPDGGTGWNRQTVGTTPIPGWNGGVVTAVPNGQGGNAMAYMTWNQGGATGNDSWLITPQLLNVQAGDSIKFWTRKFSNYADRIDVKISTTTNNNTAAFSINLATINFATTDSGWVSRGFALTPAVTPGSNIYIAFREFVADNFNDGDALFIDLVSAGGTIIPVELAAFSAIADKENVFLSWSTVTETNNQGFSVERKAAGGEFTAIGFINGKGTTTERNEYSFVDRGVTPGTYSYRLKQVDFDGTFEYFAAAEVDVYAPTEFAMEQNYPNPFNPTTNINFSLATDSKVSLKVFNVLGQEVASLVNGSLAAGKHTINFDAKNLNSGIYFAKLEATGVNGQSFSSIKKMTLNK